MSGHDGKSARTQRRKIENTGSIKVYLSENAFMGLLVSSAEVFKKESLGYLLGYRLSDRIVVENAFGLQTARRRRRGVILHDRDQKRIEPIIAGFTKLRIIGDFHSHTPYGAKRGLSIPSREDIREMEKDKLYIIVAINERSRSHAWKENKDGTISGSMASFFFKISAYYYDEVHDTHQKTVIYCEFPPGLKVS
jgi:proteasome lid subunit RPN8/RPN11